jgi:3-hydroxyisobutyrate dehydrogenase
MITNKEKTIMDIGFIGLGVMGARMAARLLEAGYHVTVYNRTPQKAEPLVRAGAQMAEDIAFLANRAQIICTCLSMPEDVRAVYCGEAGIIHNSQEGTICIDFTTVGMGTSQEMAVLADEREIAYLDAPVSGGPEGAETGSLTVMIGGEQAAYEKVVSVLQVIGKNIQYLGSSGAGSAAKLMNQYLVAVHSMAAAEVMVTGTALGLRAEQLYEILKTSYGDSRMLRRHVGEHILERNFEPGGALKYLLKDVKLANSLVESANIAGASGKRAEAILQLALEQGAGDLDMSAIIQPLEKQVGIAVAASPAKVNTEKE